jgi:hypothetical protein
VQKSDCCCSRDACAFGCPRDGKVVLLLYFMSRARSRPPIVALSENDSIPFESSSITAHEHAVSISALAFSQVPRYHSESGGSRRSYVSSVGSLGYSRDIQRSRGILVLSYPRKSPLHPTPR